MDDRKDPVRQPCVAEGYAGQKAVTKTMRTRAESLTAESFFNELGENLAKNIPTPLEQS
jgi:hypothetical protein